MFSVNNSVFTRGTWWSWLHIRVASAVSCGLVPLCWQRVTSVRKRTLRSGSRWTSWTLAGNTWEWQAWRDRPGKKINSQKLWKEVNVWALITKYRPKNMLKSLFSWLTSGYWHYYCSSPHCSSNIFKKTLIYVKRNSHLIGGLAVFLPETFSFIFGYSLLI